MHLGSLARGGARPVVLEATAVTPEGRITPQDAGLWSDELRASSSHTRGQGVYLPALER